MAEFVIGKDIFKEPGDLYLITVNTRGVMGTGLAESFREKFPELYQRYKHDCKYRIITIGNPTIYLADDGKRYMMFPTKDRWQDDSQLSYINDGLQWIVDNIDVEDGIDPKWKIVVPPLGCGNGMLKWPDVKQTLEKFSSHIPNEMVVVVPPWMAALA
ncbi:hypothetical protein [Pseudomonas phage PA1C]|uniref:Macro domain-containing protein n=1 Tax=Pseudomonas phage vB_PaeM_PS119XW TaxID=2601632 RepID=A0A5C1K8M0_9CAUD|nr:hypothetical protein PP933_gp112 [Pseudomonas phage vB_PaeM_PS119XW]QBX32267.1 hypothetical protein [Pseudomonas phage PA1C]QEM41841.1 hypothetical protein [Pseudomonas phage vB_PaeM_PS119XW]BEG72749.1 hypothetical protein RVBP21_3770 [Pseudomonas phage BRkr]